jgi:hypothetical protein
MLNLGRGALEPLLIGIAILAGAMHWFAGGYEDLGKAFIVFGGALIAASALFYFGVKSRDEMQQQSQPIVGSRQ